MTRLARRLGTFDAVVVGLGAMIGAGVFAAIGPAVRAAGSGLPWALGLAGLVAYCNATSSAQLAALYPESGGAYVYGGRRLGPLWGFLAGWGFVIGKTASCAAMALTFGQYAAPAVARPLAVAAVVGLTSVNIMGIRKTALLTRVIVAFVLGALAVVVFASLAGGQVDFTRLELSGGLHPYRILQGAGLLFFAFAGYARIATLGEEVIEPRTTIPRAIPLALALTLMVYTAVALSALLVLDSESLARATAPLAAAVEAGRFAWLSPVVRAGATVASLGVLLSLLVGVSRTVFAMAANHDMPGLFAAVHPRRLVPQRAELAVGGGVALVVALVDLRDAIGFSSFAVLLYYAITNASALTLSLAERRWPRWLALVGLAGCAALAVTLPLTAVLPGASLFGVGALVFRLRRRASGRKAHEFG